LISNGQQTANFETTSKYIFTNSTLGYRNLGFIFKAIL
jgi:hypothetical protein